MLSRFKNIRAYPEVCSLFLMCFRCLVSLIEYILMLILKHIIYFTLFWSIWCIIVQSLQIFKVILNILSLFPNIKASTTVSNLYLVCVLRLYQGYYIYIYDIAVGRLLHYQNKNHTNNIIFKLFWLMTYIICFAYWLFKVILNWF